jgi:5S rRNA maturation endonuclease (ribonuclease M5)
MKPEERLKALEKLLSELAEDGRPKIVEGKKDKKALEEYGISNIVTIHGPLEEVASRIENEAILLTDFDKRGRMLAQRLCELLRDDGVRVDLEYRAQLRHLAGMIEMEELVSRHQSLKRGVIHGKDLHRYSKVRGPRGPRD